MQGDVFKVICIHVYNHYIAVMLPFNQVKLTDSWPLPVENTMRFSISSLANKSE